MRKFSSSLPPLGKRERQARKAADLQWPWPEVIWSLWGGTCILALVLFVACFPIYVSLLQTICTSSVCPDDLLTPATVHELSTLGLSVSSYIAWRILFSLLWMLVWLAVATLLAWRKRDEWYALLTALTCVLMGTISVVDSVAGSSSPWQWPAMLVHILSFILLFLVILLFPDGRFVPRWSCWIGGIYILQSVCYNFFPAQTFQLTAWTPIIGDLSWVSIVLAVVAIQVYRYRSVMDIVQRQQTKWVVFGFTATLLSQLGVTILLAFIPSLDQPNSFFFMAFGSDSSLTLLCIPLAFGIAILRYRLWDIDILINRTVVYSTLIMCIFGMYTLLAGYVGFLLRAKNTLLVSLLATGIVAFLLQPLREWLQRSVNRLMYGERDEPYRVIARLGQRLEATLALEEVLPAIVEIVGRSLKLPYVAISLKQHSEDKIVACYGVCRATALRFPLVSQTEAIGELLLASRAASEPFTGSERQLLNELARQTGMAIQRVLLTADLERSRLRIVSTREEARRRLGNDLHDGLGHALTSLVHKIDTSSHLLESDPAAAQNLLIDVKQQARSMIDEIRRLAHDLHPPDLELLGLVPALRERVQQYDQPDRSPLQVTVEAPSMLGSLPLAVEAAAYYIVLEAVNNVYRHADARHCHLRLELLSNDEHSHPLLDVWNTAILILEICDDGCGIPVAEQDKGIGLGIISMRERAAELGGTCLIEQAAQGGTRVFVRLPCMLSSLM